MSKKFLLGISTNEGDAFGEFLVHAIRMPDGRVYDAVNGWREDGHPNTGGSEAARRIRKLEQRVTQLERLNAQTGTCRMEMRNTSKALRIS